MKTHLTPFQLFFLTFLYVFSGLSTADANSLSALALPILLLFLWAVIGYLGACKKRETLADFLSAYMPKGKTGIPLFLFFLTAAAQAVVLLIKAGTILTMEADFLPFFSVLFVLLFLAILTVSRGVTVLGRFSELSLFLIVPLILIHVFADLTPIKTMGELSAFSVVFSVMPAPVFFMLSMTTVSGDTGTTDGFRAVGSAPKNRGRYLTRIVTLGAVFAALLRVFLLLFPIHSHDLLVYFLEYTAHVATLSLLFLLLSQGFRKKNAKAALCGILPMIMGILLTLAIVGGAWFSPFLWITLLISLNLTVAVMLGIFALRSVS